MIKLFKISHSYMGYVSISYINKELIVSVDSDGQGRSCIRLMGDKDPYKDDRELSQLMEELGNE